MSDITGYDHPRHGLITAPPAEDGDPAMADWRAVRISDHEVIGYVTDSRADNGRDPSGDIPEDEDARPFEAFTARGDLITNTHTLRGALAAIGNLA